MTTPRKYTLPLLREMHAQGEKIAMLTCYDATFARVLDEAGVDCMLVGDSLGMVLQGHDTPLPVTHADMAYHVRCVARGNRNAWVVADMPFASYVESREQALRSAAALMQAGAHMVKLEGGEWLADTVAFLTQRGIPVCGHVGLLPQSVHALGGWRVQGRGDAAAATLQSDAKAIEQAGASMLVVELVPAALAASITGALQIPVIGIGAGRHCSGQVLVLHDALGLNDKPARFVRDFMQGAQGIAHAVRRYVAAVKDGSFPNPESDLY